MAKVKITETVLRDGHQSLLATRMRLSQMLPQLEALDAIGYKSLEAWGGATFDSCLRFLDEDPWERLDTLKAHLKTPIQMLLRGQNLLGYYQYPDDVVRAFVKKAAQHGIGVFRIFDALNDTRNLKTAVEAAKEAKAEVEHSVEVQGCLVYTVGGPHTIAEFGKLAKELDAMGVDSICIKDMSGLLKPYDAYELVKELKASTKLPIQLHTHYTSGFGSMAYMKAIEAGVDVIDCALSPFAMDTSQPCTETMVAALEGTEYDTGLDRQAMTPIAKHFLGVKKEIIDEFGLKGYFDVNPNVLDFQIPGGMLSNLVNQLKEMGMADKYQDHRRIRRRARTHLPHFRGIPGRQGRGDPGRGDYGYLSAGSTALLRRMGRDPDDDALRFTRLDRGRLLLSGLHDRFAQSEPIGAFHRLLVRHGRSAALHPPQKYRSAEKRHGIQNIHLEAPSKSRQIARYRIRSETGTISE